MKQNRSSLAIRYSVLLLTDTWEMQFCIFFVGISGPGQPWVKVMEVSVSGGHGTSVHLVPQSVL